MKTLEFNTKIYTNNRNKQMSISLPKKQIKNKWKLLPKNIKVTLEFLN